MEIYNLTVIRIEGIQDISSSNLYIYLGQNILRVLNLEFLDTNPTAVPIGALKLVIENSQSAKQANLSFDSSIFKRPGYHWLPLFISEEKTLSAVPEEVALPRILIDVQAHILTPVQELTEDSETIEESLNDLNRNDLEKELRMSRLEILEIDEEFKETENSLILKHEIAEFKEKLEESNKRIEKLNEVIEQKVLHCRKLENKLVENEKHQKRLQKELEVLNENWEERAKQLTFQIGEKENEIFCLKMKKQKLCVCFGGSLGVSQRVGKNQNDEESRVSALKTLEEIDRKLRRYLIGKNFEGLVSVSNEVNYTIFNKKIPIFLKNDVLFTKYDGSVKKLDYFFSINKTTKEKEKTKQNSTHLKPQTCGNNENAYTADSFLPRNSSISKIKNRSITPIRKSVMSPTNNYTQ